MMVYYLWLYYLYWYGNNLFDITEIHNTLLETVLN